MPSTLSESDVSPEQPSRLNHTLGPVAAGMIIDAVDLITFGPLGLVAGIPLGGIAGYWLGQSLGLEKRTRLLCAAAAAVYCTIPFTELLPLGTLVGAYARYKQDQTREGTLEVPPPEPLPEHHDASGDARSTG